MGGLIKHAAVTEKGWIQTLIGNVGYANEQAYWTASPWPTRKRSSRLSPISTRSLLRPGGVAAGRSRRQVQLPEAPWYPQDPDGFSASLILLHVLEELARHAGHADI